MTAELGTLLLGLLAFLALATLALAVLRRRPGFRPDLAQNISLRIQAWWVIVPLMGGALMLGTLATVILFAILSALALREVLALSPVPDRAMRLAAFGLVLPAQYALILANWYGLFAILIPVYAAFLLPAIAALGAGASGFMARVAETFWALLLTVYAVSHLPALLFLDVPGFDGQPGLIAWSVVTVQASDVAQFIWGKAMGRRPVAPVLSPSKTWEGLIGGTMTATALGASLWWLTPFGPLWAAIMAAVLCLLGFLGGLILSAVKRDRGVKDWGRLVPGHGGVMDRLDSLIFAAPLFFHLTRYGWAVS